MSKTKHESFEITVKALPYLSGKFTPREKCESVFVQSHIFVGGILSAIVALNPEDGLENSDEAGMRLCTQTLALIGQAFTAEIHKQFQELLEMTEAKTNEK